MKIKTISNIYKKYIGVHFTILLYVGVKISKLTTPPSPSCGPWGLFDLGFSIGPQRLSPPWNSQRFILTMLRFPVQGNSIVTHLSKQSSSRQNLLVSTLNSKMVQIVHFVSCCGPTTRNWWSCQSLLRSNDYGANFVTAFKVRIRQSDQLFFFMWYLIPLDIWLLKVL